MICLLPKILIICGPTATGKTSFSIELARKFSGEIISADSRQVYQGMDIVTGKDLPPEAKSTASLIKWKDRFLKYYLINKVKIWLYDVVKPSESFNVSFWHECAQLVISDILSRNKLPIVVGGTGLYLKSLIYDLSAISIPPDQQLRQSLSNKSTRHLFDYLASLNAEVASKLNNSDRNNPRRLIRQIEIISSGRLPQTHLSSAYSFLSLGLTAPTAYLFKYADKRILTRLSQGAIQEATRIASVYSSHHPSFSACGYSVLLTPNPIANWQKKEHAYIRRQLTWFKKQLSIRWFDITKSDWQIFAEEAVFKWYNLKQ